MVRLFRWPSSAVLAASILALLTAACIDTPLYPEPIGPDAMRAELVPEGFAGEVPAGSLLSGTVLVRNAGRAVFPADGKISPSFKVSLGVRWLDGATEIVVVPYGDWRAALPSRLRPGASVSVPVEIQAPSVPGRYILEFDLIQDGVAWFGDKGSRTGRVPVRVSPI